jgi:hypothetical protein
MLPNEKKRHKKLIHVFNNNTSSNLDKYIQLSTDFKTISIPENNNIFVFGIWDIIKNNIPAMFSENMILVDEENSDHIHKCFLYENNYVIIHIIDNKYVVTLYDLIKKLPPKIIDLNMSVDHTTIKFSLTCKYLLTLNGINGQVDLINLQNITTESSFIVKNYNSVIKNTITISDDGKLVTFFTTNNFLVLLDNKNENKIKIKNIVVDNKENIKTYNVFILHNKNFLNSQNNNAINNIYFIVLWRKEKLFIWSIIDFDEGFCVYTHENKNMIECCLSENETIKSVYTNGSKYICETETPENKIYYYDLGIIIPFIIIDIFLSIIKSELCQNSESQTQKKKKLMIKTITYDEEYVADTWLADSFTNNELVVDSSFADVMILTCEKNLQYTSLQLVLTFLQDYKKIKKYTQLIHSQSHDNRDVFRIVDMVSQIKNKIKLSTSQKYKELVVQHMEYTVIYFALLYYFFGTTNGTTHLSKTDVENFTKMLNSLDLTKIFLIKSLKMLFGVDITPSVIKKDESSIILYHPIKI